MRVLFHGAVVLILTVLTQLGGIAWVLALLTRKRLLAFVVFYLALSVAAVFTAPGFGRVPLRCLTGDLRIQTPLFCALNRHYVTPALYDVADRLATQMAVQHPGTKTRALDGNFPFLTGFPLLPHLSHDDGEKLDFAFYWQDAQGRYRAGQSKSPLGYWGYAEGPTNCPISNKDLRWDMAWLQQFRAGWRVDLARQRDALRHLAKDPAVAKILIEPHLSKALNVASDKIRFQGCRAARHDDHIHVQL